MLHRLTIDAFTLRHETSESALGLTNLPSFARSNIRHHEGGLVAAVNRYLDHPSGDVIIVEDDGDSDELNRRLEALSHVVEPGRKLIVVGRVNDIGVYRRMLTMGVAEYLLSPCSVDDLVAAIEHVTHDPHGPARGKVFAFIGTRGGVGSSSIAQNVAWSLANQLGQRTILVDLDLTFGTAALAFNEEPRQPVQEALADPERLDQVLLQRFMIGEDDRLQILSTNGTLRNVGPPSQAAIEKLVDLSRQMADFVVLDLPHSWSKWVEDLLVLADEAVLVALLDLANLRDARNLVELLRAKRGEGKEPRLVVNKADLVKRSRLTIQDMTKTLSTKPLATLPFDPQIFVEAINDGKMIAEKAKKHKAAVALHEISIALSGLKQQAPRRTLGFSAFAKRPATKPARA